MLDEVTGALNYFHWYNRRPSHLKSGLGCETEDVVSTPTISANPFVHVLYPLHHHCSHSEYANLVCSLLAAGQQMVWTRSRQSYAWRLVVHSSRIEQSSKAARQKKYELAGETYIEEIVHARRLLGPSPSSVDLWLKSTSLGTQVWGVRKNDSGGVSSQDPRMGFVLLRWIIS
jgi:hypothetical protein